MKKDTFRFFATIALIVSVLATFNFIKTKQEIVTETISDPSISDIATEAKNAATSSAESIMNSAAS